MRFEAKFEGDIQLFDTKGGSALSTLQFKSAALVISVGFENSVAVEIAFSMKVNENDVAPEFTGKSSSYFFNLYR